MCVEVISGPTADHSGNGVLTVRIGLRNSTPTTVTVTCRPGPPASPASRTVEVDGPTDIEVPVSLGGAGSGGHVVDVEVREEGCATMSFPVGVPIP